MNINCPACGSVEFDKKDNTRSSAIPFGSPATWTETNYTCKVCGESGDFAETNDENIMLAISEANKASIILIIDDLNKLNLTSAYIERAFELPARTLAKWKSGSYSAAALALLRVVRTYPWLTAVADSNFDRNYSDSLILGEASRIFSANKQRLENSSYSVNRISPEKTHFTFKTTINAESLHPAIISETSIKPQTKEIGKENAIA